MEKEKTSKLRELGLTDDQIEAVQTLYENQEKAIRGELDEEKEHSDPKIPINIRPDTLEVEKIQELYDETSLEFAFEPTNNETREKLRKKFEKRFPYYTIKCDEENNPPDVADAGEIWLRITYAETFEYVDLVF